MTRKELDRLDDLLAAEYGASFVGYLTDGFKYVRFYQSTTQRLLVEVRDGMAPVIYSHHKSETV